MANSAPPCRTAVSPNAHRLAPDHLGPLGGMSGFSKILHAQGFSLIRVNPLRANNLVSLTDETIALLCAQNDRSIDPLPLCPFGLSSCEHSFFPLTLQLLERLGTVFRGRSLRQGARISTLQVWGPRRDKGEGGRGDAEFQPLRFEGSVQALGPI